MNRELFERQYGSAWAAFERMLEHLEGQSSGIKTGLKLDGFPELYREICHHLALARARRYGVELEERLNRLALRGHQQLYLAPSPITRSGLAEFFASTFPRALRRELRLFWLAAGLLYLPALLSLVLVHAQPELAYSFLGPEEAASFEHMYSPEGQKERASKLDVYMFGYYIYNNISVSFRTFASGLICGLGAIFFLVYNGLMFGAAAGHVGNFGHSEAFFSFVVAHGAFELTAIVISGLAGLRLGLALLSPGQRSRARALYEEARVALPLIYGVIAMLLVAAFLEAFWSSNSGLPTPLRLGAGALCWGLVIAYFSLAGRSRGS